MTTEMRSGFGGRLEAIRLSLGLGQADMAAQMGVSLRSYSRYANDDRAPQIDDVISLAAVGVNLNWLLTGQGSMMVDGAPVMVPSPDQSAPENARIEELERALAAEKEKTAKWIEGAKHLLAGCIMAADQISREQRLNLSPKQKASMATSMFIEMGSLTDEQIHTMMGGNQGKGIKKG